MNERIHDLAMLARKHFPKTETSGEFWVLDEEKFAELIVVECAMFVVTELEGKVGSAIADATANKLEEHFGVEE